MDERHVVSTTTVWTDAQGRRVDGPEHAVAGEILTTYSDGAVMSRLVVPTGR